MCIRDRLGPRPGKAACSFSQGIVEIVLRAVKAVLGLGPLITGILILAFNASYDGDEDADSETLETDSSGITAAITDDEQAMAVASGVLCLITGALLIIWAVIMIILRFLNIGLLNLGSKYFLAIDIAVNLVIAIIAIIAGIVTAVAAPDWNDIDNDDAEAVFGSMVAAIIFCFIAAIVVIVFAVYMIVYIVKNWNQEIIKYTIKEAITG